MAVDRNRVDCVADVRGACVDVDSIRAVAGAWFRIGSVRFMEF